MYIEGDVPYVTGTNNGNNNGWNDWSWIIGLALVGGLFGGWGGNGGFGFGGGRGGYYGGGFVTNDELQMGFFRNDVADKLDGINYGLANGFYETAQQINGVQSTLCQGFAGVNATVNQGFAGVNNAICTLGYNQATLINGLSRELADCCCKTQKEILDLKYSNERQTCDIIRANENNTKAILDYLTTEKISSLQAENSGLKAQISNDRQSAYIVNALSPKCPQPAYVVQPPQEVTFPTNCCGNVAYANYNNNCCC
jgi:hypothetical protein